MHGGTYHALLYDDACRFVDSRSRRIVLSSSLRIFFCRSWNVSICGQAGKFGRDESCIVGAKDVLVNLLQPGEEEVVSVMQQAPDLVSRAKQEGVHNSSAAIARPAVARLERAHQGYHRSAFCARQLTTACLLAFVLPTPFWLTRENELKRAGFFDFSWCTYVSKLRRR